MLERLRSGRCEACGQVLRVTMLREGPMPDHRGLLPEWWAVRPKIELGAVSACPVHGVGCGILG